MYCKISIVPHDKTFLVQGLYRNFNMYSLIQVKNDETGDRCWVQVGVVSWGWGCRQSYRQNQETVRYPGYYSNVVASIDWIKNGT